ncbi:MAG: NAD-dependent epimerase/dehydratase family protein [Terriglobia bacterium]
MSTPKTQFWKDKTVLVTGATGLLGGWLVKELLPLGANVVALIRDGNPRSMLNSDGLLARISTVSGSIEDFNQVRRAMCEYEVHTVFHLAAQPIVGVAKLDPMGTLETNVRGTWNILEAARLAKVPQVLVASSDKAYGSSDTLPYTENHPLQGRFPYDVSKSCADLIATMYANAYGLPVVITRCANLFGGGDLNFSRLVPDLIRRTLAGKPFLIRSNGLFVRDYVYVRDAVAGLLRLTEALAGDPSLAGQAFNFSMGVRQSVLELVDQVLEAMGRTDLKPIILNQASLEIKEQFMSAQKARDVLDWECRYAFPQALAETIAWYRSFFEATPDGRLLARTADSGA